MSAAPLSAPADDPTTTSTHRVRPSRSTAAVMPAETTPRMLPPSSTIATRCGSRRAPGDESVRYRSRRTWTTGWIGSGIRAFSQVRPGPQAVAPPSGTRPAAGSELPPDGAQQLPARELRGHDPPDRQQRVAGIHRVRQLERRRDADAPQVDERLGGPPAERVREQAHRAADDPGELELGPAE